MKMLTVKALGLQITYSNSTIMGHFSCIMCILKWSFSLQGLPGSPGAAGGPGDTVDRTKICLFLPSLVSFLFSFTISVVFFRVNLGPEARLECQVRPDHWYVSNVRWKITSGPVNYCKMHCTYLLGWTWSSWWGWDGRSSWTKGRRPELDHKKNPSLTDTHFSCFTQGDRGQRGETGPQGIVGKPVGCCFYKKNCFSSWSSLLH